MLIYPRGGQTSPVKGQIAIIGGLVDHVISVLAAYLCQPLGLNLWTTQEWTGVVCVPVTSFENLNFIQFLYTMKSSLSFISVT